MGLLLVLAALLLPVEALALPDVGGRGRHLVGLTHATFTKASETTGAPRPLATFIWYPAAPGTGTVEANPFDPRDDAVVLLDAAVARGRWPLIMFSHGSCGIAQQSPYLMQGLASWGFVVASPAHLGNTFDDCSATRLDSYVNRPADISFVLDELLAAAKEPGTPWHRRLNPRRLGMSGHSFGGHTTLRVAAADPRVRAAAALAPSDVAGDIEISVPTLVMTGLLDDVTPFETDARAAFAALTGPRFLIGVERAGHCAFIPLCITDVCGAGCEPGLLGQREANQLVNRYVVPFFLRYLRGQRKFGRLLEPARAPAGLRIEEARPRRQ
jgi:predicted dienelactone hydrolase